MKTLNEILHYTRELKKTMTEHGLDIKPVVLDFSDGLKFVEVSIFGVKSLVNETMAKEMRHYINVLKLQKIVLDSWDRIMSDIVSNAGNTNYTCDR